LSDSNGSEVDLHAQSGAKPAAVETLAEIE
jgi:hypothetical protein